MKLVKCDSGHFYDAERFTRCPHCYSIDRYPDTIRPTSDADHGYQSEHTPENGKTLSLLDSESVGNSKKAETIRHAKSHDKKRNRQLSARRKICRVPVTEFRINWKGGFNHVVSWIFLTVIPSLVPLFVFYCARSVFGMEVDVSIATTIEFCAFTLSITVANWNDGRNLIVKGKLMPMASHIFYLETIYFMVFYSMICTVNIGLSSGAIERISADVVNWLYTGGVVITIVTSGTAAFVQFVKGSIIENDNSD